MEFDQQRVQSIRRYGENASQRGDGNGRFFGEEAISWDWNGKGKERRNEIEERETMQIQRELDFTHLEVVYPLQSIHPLRYFLLFSKPQKIAIEFNPDPNSLFPKDPNPLFVSPAPYCCQAEQCKSS